MHRCSLLTNTPSMQASLVRQFVDGRGLYFEVENRIHMKFELFFLCNLTDTKFLEIQRIKTV